MGGRLALRADIVRELVAACSNDGSRVRTDEESLREASEDMGVHRGATPDALVLPRDAEETAAVVRLGLASG